MVTTLFFFSVKMKIKSLAILFSDKIGLRTSFNFYLAYLNSIELSFVVHIYILQRVELIGDKGM